MCKASCLARDTYNARDLTVSPKRMLPAPCAQLLRTSRDRWALPAVHCGPVIPRLPWYISGQSASPPLPPLMVTASKELSICFFICYFFLHLLLFPTIPRDIHYFCATLQLQSILSDSRASGFHTLSCPGRTTMPTELTVGEMGWDESTPKAKMSHAQVVLNNIKDYLSLTNACLIVVCP